VRFFNKPKNGMEASHNKMHELPPQSTNSSIMKYALCLMKTHIEDNDLDDKVKLLLSVHDQQVSVRRLRCTVGNQTELMEKLLCMLYLGALKAESDIMDHWTKG
jgi:hypothetical protein